MKLLRLNKTTWINPDMISVVKIKRPSETKDFCDVFAGNEGGPIDEFCDPKIFKILEKNLKLPK